MRFPRFLKSQTTVDIPLEKLDDWLENQHRSKEFYTELLLLEREIYSKKTAIKKILAQMQSNKPSIPHDEKLAGHHKNKLTQKTEEYLSTLHIHKKYDEIHASLTKQAEKTSQLEEELQKHYHALKDTYKEAEDLMKKIKEIDDILSNSLYALEKTNNKNFVKIKTLIDKYKETKKKLEENETKKEELYKQRFDLLAIHNKYKEKLERTKNSKGYKELKDIEKKLSEKEQEHNRKRNPDLKKELKEEIEILKKRSRGHPLKFEEKEQQGWVENTSKKIEEITSQMEKLQVDIEDLNPNLYKQKINEELKNTKKKVRVK